MLLGLKEVLPHAAVQDKGSPRAVEMPCPLSSFLDTSSRPLASAEKAGRSDPWPPARESVSALRSQGKGCRDQRIACVPENVALRVRLSGAERSCGAWRGLCAKRCKAPCLDEKVHGFGKLGRVLSCFKLPQTSLQGPFGHSGS